MDLEEPLELLDEGLTPRQRAKRLEIDVVGDLTLGGSRLDRPSQHPAIGRGRSSGEGLDALLHVLELVMAATREAEGLGIATRAHRGRVGRDQVLEHWYGPMITRK